MTFRASRGMEARTNYGVEDFLSTRPSRCSLHEATLHLEQGLSQEAVPPWQEARWRWCSDHPRYRRVPDGLIRTGCGDQQIWSKWRAPDVSSKIVTPVCPDMIRPHGVGSPLWAWMPVDQIRILSLPPQLVRASAAWHKPPNQSPHGFRATETERSAFSARHWLCIDCGLCFACFAVHTSSCWLMGNLWLVWMHTALRPCLKNDANIRGAFFQDMVFWNWEVFSQAFCFLWILWY